MRQIACPLHRPLGEYCAKTILEQHAAALPDLTRLAILVPNATSSRALRSALLDHAESDHQGLLLPPIMTFPAWARQHSHFNATENHLSELLDLVAALQKSETLRSLEQADSWSLAREMMELFDQLWLNEVSLPSDQEELTSRLRDAYQVVGRPPDQLGNEARIIHLLWTAWSQGSGSFLSSGKYYREALQHLAPAPETEAIYVCGHDRLTAVEIEALKRLDQEVPVSIFSRPQSLMSLNMQASVSSNPPSPYAAVLQEAFAQEKPTMAERAQACSLAYPQDPLKNRLFTFVAEQAEPHARGIDIQIRRWLKEGHQKIGLVTEDRKLARRVRALLEHAGIQVQDYSGWALSTTSAASTVGRWLECLNQDFHYLALLDILKSPFVCLKEASGKPDRIEDFEQFLHRHNIHNNLENYRRIADGEPDWLDMLEQVEQAAHPLQALREPTGGEYMRALLESLNLLGCQPRLASDEAGQQVLSELERMCFQLSQSETQLSKSQWNALLRWTLEQQNFRPRSSQDLVTLINLNHAHLARFDCLIVAGMDSRHYPGTDAAFLVFNDSVRGDLGLPTRTELKKLDLQRFLSLILSSEQVLLSYQKADQDEPLLPSIWWSQIDVFYRLAYKASLKEPSLPVLSLHPDAWVRPPELQVRETTSEVMPHPPANLDLLPSNISASGHQALVDCPYRFYVRDMLRIREIDMIREEMDNIEFGSYVHQCLEAFHSDIPDAPGPWQGLIDSCNTAAFELLQEIGVHFMGQLTPNPSNIVFLERWKSIARRYVEFQNLVEKHQSIIEIEQKVEHKVDEGLILRGRIDRMDEDQGGNRIVIDYKTGSKKISKGEVQSGEQVQLPSYALMAEPVGRAEYWWLDQNSQEEVPLTSVEEALLGALGQKVHNRLHKMFQDLRENHDMPAHGDKATCKFCYAQGVCRKDMEIGNTP